MMEALVIAVCGGLIISGLAAFADACSGPFNLRSDEDRQRDYREKWGRGGKAAFLLVAAIILAAIVAYLGTLNYLGVLS